MKFKDAMIKDNEIMKMLFSYELFKHILMSIKNEKIMI